MKAWLERLWFPLLVAALAVFGLLVLALVLPAMYDFDPTSSWTWLFSIRWYYFAGLAAALFLSSAKAYKYSPQRRTEWEQQQAKLRNWRSWYNAFLNGSVSEYPKINSGSFGYIPRQGEICCMATTKAVLGRGNAHQLEITRSSNAGVDLKGVTFGQAAGTKDSYSTIDYDESHIGTLLISNQRVSFISPPSVFIEIVPEQILSIGWLEQYVMMRTGVSSDESKNLIAIRIADELPAWLFAAAIFRLKADSSSPPARGLI